MAQSSGTRAGSYLQGLAIGIDGRYKKFSITAAFSEPVKGATEVFCV